MRVKDLITTLQHYDENMEVMIVPHNSNYADSIYSYGCAEMKLSSFWGKDKICLCIKGDDQVGAVHCIYDDEEE